MAKGFKSRLLAGTIVFGALGITAPAYAQEATDQQEPQAGPIEGSAQTPAVNAQGEPTSQTDIVVTGSRISRPNLESTSPVTVVGSQEIEQSGTTRVEDLVNSLPQAFAGQTAFVSNGATGTASVDLRNLGSTRTLVLVNGRRLQPGDPSFPVADLNQIPAALIERIEVVTGGASSVYGADAVAGVVNFIMDTDFRGFQLDMNYGFYQHENGNRQTIDTVGGDEITIIDRLNQRNFSFPKGMVVDGATWDTTITLGAGTDDGRGNLVGYAGYRQVDPIFQGRRDYSACALSRTGAGRVICGGSFTTPQGTITEPSFGRFFLREPNGEGGFRNFSGAYNFAPPNYFQRPDKRYTAGFFAEYEVSDVFKPFAEFMFMDDRSVAQIAESGTFFADTINVRCDSPLLTPQQGAELCARIDGQARAGDPVRDGVVPLLIGKRNVEGGPRQDDLRHTAYRTVIGARGDVTAGWRYEVSGQFGTTIFAETYLNDLSRTRLRNALNATVDANGNVVCAAVVDGTDPNCRPYNPFQGPGLVTDPRRGVTQAALDYIQTPGLQRGETEEFIVNGFVNGELFTLAASEPVSVVVGAEYRKEQLSREVDVAFATGDLAGQGGPTPNVSGQFDVKEVFTELLVPIVSDVPFVHRLSLELGYRYSDYSISGTTDTYKIAANFEPVRWLRFRGGYNRAVRAPNILELFSPRREALFGGDDPCAGPTPQFTAAQCANTGVRPGQFGNISASPADQYNQIIGGNQSLTPEKADTYTVGVVFEPREFFPGFALTLDGFKIDVENAISTLGAQTILNQCALSGDPTFCRLVNRDPISGNLFVGQNAFIVNTTQNIGGFGTQGVDIGVTYNRRLGPGRVSLDFQGTYLDELYTDSGVVPASGGGDGRFDCVGFHGSRCGTPAPEWRHYLRASYNFDTGVGLSVRWRHIGSVELDQFSSDPDLGTRNPDARGNIKGFDWFDLTANFNVTEQFRMLIGVNNILDKDPPIFPSSFGGDNANTWAGTYDPVGRRFFVSGTLKY